MPFGKIMVEKTPTFTSTAKSGDTVRGLVGGPYASDWWLEIVQDSRAVLTRTLGTNPSRES